MGSPANSQRLPFFSLSAGRTVIVGPVPLLLFRVRPFRLVRGRRRRGAVDYTYREWEKANPVSHLTFKHHPLVARGPMPYASPERTQRLGSRPPFVHAQEAIIPIEHNVPTPAVLVLSGRL
jgi:hypothetical protein